MDDVEEEAEATETPEPGEVTEEPQASTGAAAPTTPLGGVTPQPRFVRDPNAKLGGVASGLAHTFGWDVAITRLVFVIALLLSFGSALLIYIAAWVIIPRAKFWPPVPRPMQTGFRGRELAIALIVFGVFLALLFDQGVLSILVPLALVAGGVYLLIQPPDVMEESEPLLVPPPVPQGAGASPQDVTAPFQSEVVVPQAVPQPVKRRSRFRRLLIGGFASLVVLLIAAFIAATAFFLWAVFSGEDFDTKVEVTPLTVDDVPTSIVETSGSIIVDLRQLSIEELEALDEPLNMIVDLDFGEIDVLLPPGMRVAATGDANLGAVNFFENSSEGLSPDDDISEQDPHINLDLNLKIGEIELTRSDTASSGVTN